MLCASHPARLLSGMCWRRLISAHPELYQLRGVETTIITTGPSQGRTKVESGGRRIQAIR